MSSVNHRVQILSTGGTIQNPPEEEGYMTGEALCENIPELQEVAEIDVEEISRVASQNVTPTIWSRLATRIMELDSEDTGPDGFVITSGSNALEETAYFLNLVLNTDTPVVLTAAQRNHTFVGNDGDKNLLDSVRVAATPESRDRGVLMAVNEEIHQARDATKVINSRPNGWSSGDFGPLGVLDKYGHIQYYRKSEKKHTSGTPFEPDTWNPEAIPDVEIVYASAGASSRTIDLLLEDGVDGLVLAGFASGHAADPESYDSQSDAVERAVERGIPVAVTHRGRRGWTYFYPRSFQTPLTEQEGYLDEWNYMVEEDDAYVWADNLTPQKARILLTLGLAVTTSPEDLQEFFYEF